MGGVWNRIKLAVLAFFSILFQGRLPAALRDEERTAAPAAAAPATTAPPLPAREDAPDRAVQVLALLQRDGRLVDFLMEDLGGYDDAQIGAAVRDVHAGCRRALDRHVTLASILAGQEGEAVTLESSIDPSTVHLVGNVTARPPFSGRLLHRGWRVERMTLPPLGDPHGRAVVAQAEIEVA
jgi:Domain of unknown function (DUF2760)